MHNLYNNKEYSPRVLSNSSKKIAFYWSPKAGCSVVAKMFLKYIDYYSENNIPVISQRDNYIFEQISISKHVCDRSNQSNMCYKDYFKIQMVRNPYTRAISSYLKYLNLYPSISLSFQTYLELIVTKTLKEHHIWPQYLIDPESLNYIIRFENIALDVQNLCNEHGLCFDYTTEPVEPSYTRFSNNTTNNCSNFEYKFIRDSVITNVTNDTIGIPEYSFFYNQKCKLLVEEIYGYDIEIFNYQFPYELS